MDRFRIMLNFFLDHKKANPNTDEYLYFLFFKEMGGYPYTPTLLRTFLCSYYIPPGGNIGAYFPSFGPFSM